MRDRDNIRKIIEARPDILGFIFYPGSARYIGNNPDKDILPLIPEDILKAGVFVNEKQERILDQARQFDLDLLQLHGQESVASCKALRDQGYSIIKAFGLGVDFDFDRLILYLPACDYFLFDTESERHGGTGKKFNWNMLENYKLGKPFFLSGGIGPEDAAAIKNLNHPAFYAVDINSRFEVVPGIKDPEKVKTFISQIKTNQS